MTWVVSSDFVLWKSVFILNSSSLSADLTAPYSVCATARGDLEGKKKVPLQERSCLCGFPDSLDGLSFLRLSALRVFTWKQSRDSKSASRFPGLRASLKSSSPIKDSTGVSRATMAGRGGGGRAWGKGSGGGITTEALLSVSPFSGCRKQVWGRQERWGGCVSHAQRSHLSSLFQLWDWMLWPCGLQDGQVFIMLRDDEWFLYDISFSSLFPRSQTIKTFKHPIHQSANIYWTSAMCPGLC